MDYLFLSAQLAVGFFIIFLSVIFFFLKSKPTKHKLPPGKTGWPIVGETLDFVSCGRSGQPEKFVNERMGKYSEEIFKTSIAGEKMAVFCGAAGNKFLFSNEKKLLVAWWPPTVDKITISPNSCNTLMAKKMHNILPEYVKPEGLQKCVPIIDSTTKVHLEKEWSSPTREVKVFPLSKELTIFLACKLFMSVEDPKIVAKIADDFALVITGLLSVPINFPGTAFHRAVKAANSIRKVLVPIMKERRKQLMVGDKELASSSYDLLSQVLLSKDEDGEFLNEMENADMILGILIASHDTTSTVMTFVVYYLADHPHVYDQVFKEQMEIAKSKGPEELLNWEDIQKMKYSRNVINEVMRLEPPSQGAFKHAVNEFTYGGFTIPKGWKAFWSVYSTHRDPKYFPNPDKFDPSRFEGNGPMPYTFVPFGGGPRMCPGREFARLEILVFMHRLVMKFKWEKLIPNEKIIYQPSPIPVNGLPIRLFPHEN
ncbi:hypothetical protein LguiA_036676 [Lonicera macranthoides]